MGHTVVESEDKIHIRVKFSHHRHTRIQLLHQVVVGEPALPIFPSFELLEGYEFPVRHEPVARTHEPRRHDGLP